MSDTLTVRDHSRTCGHKHDQGGVGGAYKSEGIWHCERIGCPGGGEIVLERLVPASSSGLILVQSGMWVEVTDE